MSPTHFHAKQEPQHDGINNTFNHTLHKITTNIHRLPPSPSTGSSTSPDTLTTKPPQQQQQPRRPVIIYTHSPKVIHTHPRDFMALVQKLTGYTPQHDETTTQTNNNQDRRNHRGNIMEDNESTSVVTEDHGASVNDNIPQVNSNCFVDHNNNSGVGVNVGVGVGYDPYFLPNNSPVFQTGPNDFLCATSHQVPFYNHDPMFMNPNSYSSSSSLRVLKEYPDI
ncbi:VQ motif-containing protein 20-like [Rutidosis leptorrhynchoides]|uniref:VQ motif-containing protein 20-like n=1 Tax=Rutidosis leptorrhynchoides TaxID=125765 RepID=UPI003A98F8E7